MSLNEELIEASKRGDIGKVTDSVVEVDEFHISGFEIKRINK